MILLILLVLLIVVLVIVALLSGLFAGGAVITIVVLAIGFIALLIKAFSGHSSDSTQETEPFDTEDQADSLSGPWPALLTKKANEMNSDLNTVIRYQPASDRVVPSSIRNILDRAYVALTGSLYDEADIHFDRILDVDSHFAPAYMGKLLCQLHIRDENLLVYSGADFSTLPHYLSACRFATEEELDKYRNFLDIRTYNFFEANRSLYEHCKTLNAFNIKTIKENLRIVESSMDKIITYPDAEILKKEAEALLRTKKLRYIGLILSLCLLAGGVIAILLSFDH